MAGTTVLLVEHDMGFVMDIADSVIGAEFRAPDLRRIAGGDP